MTGRFPRIVAVISLLAPGVLAPGVLASAQQGVAPDAGCVLHKGSYVCNWSSFKLAFERAHTVAVETGPMDRPTAAQLDTLISQLGKTRAAQGQAADLTMLLIPVEPSGVNMGPSDHDIATLRIYAPNSESSRGVLLWAETLRGQGDRPWPGQVHMLIEQFQDRFPRH